MKWTEALVIDRLRVHYATLDTRAATHNLLTQVGVGGRIIDALILTNDPVELIAVEVKVSRSDFRNDTDAKRAPAWQVAHRCLYAAPVGLINPEWLPTGWGLIEVAEPGDTVLAVAGDRHEPTIGADPFTWSMLRRAAGAEDAIRTGDLPAAEVARLRQDVDRHAAAVQRAHAARVEYRQQAVAAQSELLGVRGMQECADCGKPVTWLRRQRVWTHVDAAHQWDCLRDRTEADRSRREQATGTAYGWGFPGDVEPKAIRAALSAS